MAPGPHEHIFSSDLMFSHWNRGSCAAKEEVEDVQAYLEGRKEKLVEAFDVKDQACL